MNFGRNIEIDFQQDRSFTEFSLSSTPYVSAVDAEEEYLIIFNPGSEPYPLQGHFISDGHQLHVFCFPAYCIVPPRTELYVYTAPGASNHNEPRMEPHVLWTNADGTLRKKEVLNNDHCSVQLYTPNGKCIASCKAAGKDGPAEVQRRFEELHNLPRLECTPPMQLLLCVLRIVVLLFMAFCIQRQPTTFVALYWVAFILDLFARSERETTKAVMRFTLLADRMTTLVISGAVLLMEIMHNYATASSNESVINTALGRNSNWLLISPASIIIAVLLDFSARTLCPSMDILYGSSTPTSIRSSKHGELLDEHGHYSTAYSVNGILLQRDVYSAIRRLNPVLLTAVCIASEYYLLHCYNTYHYVVPTAQESVPGILTALLTVAGVMGWISFCVRQANNISIIIKAISKM